MYGLVGDGGQLVGVVSDYFSFRQVDINSPAQLGSQGLNSGHQAWWQAPLPTETSCWSMGMCRGVMSARTSIKTVIRTLSY